MYVLYHAASPLRTHSSLWILMTVPTKSLPLCLLSQRTSRAFLAFACKTKIIVFLAAELWKNYSDFHETGISSKPVIISNGGGLLIENKTNILKGFVSREAEGSCTSNTDSPDSLLRAANSRIIVPAHAVQVSDSVPVRESGFRTPYRRFTWKSKK